MYFFKHAWLRILLRDYWLEFEQFSGRCFFGQDVIFKIGNTTTRIKLYIHISGLQFTCAQIMLWIWANEKFWMYSPRRSQLGRNNIFATKSHSYRLERDDKSKINESSSLLRVGMSGTSCRKCNFPPAGSSEGLFRIFHSAKSKTWFGLEWTVFEPF